MSTTAFKLWRWRWGFRLNLGPVFVAGGKVYDGPYAPRPPDFEVFHEWCVENMPRAVELCPYKFPNRLQAR